MRMNTKKVCAALLAGSVLITAIACSKKAGNSQQKWSVRMAESVMERNPEPWQIDFRETPKWEYTQGLVLKAIYAVYEETGEQKYFDYVYSYYDQFINEDGSIELYKLEDYNIDRINPGKVLFPLYEKTGEERFKKALLLLRSQMKTHPRTNEGGFWHKKRYPYQMWLDGLYMGSPFLAQFAVTFDEPELIDDVINQFVWMEKHARDNETGLLYHGWDESREQRWANKETGLSPHFWGRAMGWYMMALVDVLDYIPREHPRRGEIIAILQRLSVALKDVQHESGTWYQVVDQGDREGNYLESSATSMYVYAMEKAVQKGYIDKQFHQVAQKGMEGIFSEFITVDKNGLVDINQVCGVAGLGGDPYRDGSYAYYINEIIRSNDPKAVGPFILACLEFDK